MVLYGLDIGVGGRVYSDVGEFLRSGCPCHPTVRVGDVGGNPHTKRILGGLHHRVAQRIYGNMPQRRMEGTWE